MHSVSIEGCDYQVKQYDITSDFPERAKGLRPRHLHSFGWCQIPSPCQRTLFREFSLRYSDWCVFYAAEQSRTSQRSPMLESESTPKYHFQLKKSRSRKKRLKASTATQSPNRPPRGKLQLRYYGSPSNCAEGGLSGKV